MSSKMPGLSAKQIREAIAIAEGELRSWKNTRDSYEMIRGNALARIQHYKNECERLIRETQSQMERDARDFARAPQMIADVEAQLKMLQQKQHNLLYAPMIRKAMKLNERIEKLNKKGESDGAAE